MYVKADNTKPQKIVSKTNYVHDLWDVMQPRLNTLMQRQNGRHFADNIFKCIFVNEIIWISTNIPLKFVPKGQINNISALVQIMAWRRPGDEPLSEPMMVSLLMLGRNELTHCGLVSPYIAFEILVKSGSSNGLLPDGTKPLPDPLLTYHQ